MTDRANLQCIAILVWRFPHAVPDSRSAMGVPGKPPDDSDTAYLIQRWQLERGLPVGSATAVVQTTDGYLRVGTLQWLAQFDGVTFTVFDASTAPGLPGNSIVNLIGYPAARGGVRIFSGGRDARRRGVAGVRRQVRSYLGPSLKATRSTLTLSKTTHEPGYQ